MQAKAKAAKEKADYDLCLSNLRGESRLAWKEDVAAKKAARDPRRRIAKWVQHLCSSGTSCTALTFDKHVTGVHQSYKNYYVSRHFSNPIFSGSRW